VRFWSTSLAVTMNISCQGGTPASSTTTWPRDE
jgi:hypothetical protein